MKNAVAKINKSGEAISKALVTLTPEREEVLQGLKTAAYAAYIDTVRLLLTVGAACALVLGLAMGFIFLWSWQSLGNLAVMVLFTALCLARYSQILPAEKYFFAEELRYYDSNVGCVMSMITSVSLGAVLFMAIIFFVMTGLLTTNPLIYTALILLKLAGIVGFNFALRRTIAFQQALAAFFCDSPSIMEGLIPQVGFKNVSRGVFSVCFIENLGRGVFWMNQLKIFRQLQPLPQFGFHPRRRASAQKHMRSHICFLALLRRSQREYRYQYWSLGRFWH